MENIYKLHGDQQIEAFNREVILEQRRTRQEMYGVLVPHFYKDGKISEEDYEKWILDETGEFTPTLINLNDEKLG